MRDFFLFCKVKIMRRATMRWHMCLQYGHSGNNNSNFTGKRQVPLFRQQFAAAAARCCPSSKYGRQRTAHVQH